MNLNVDAKLEAQNYELGVFHHLLTPYVINIYFVKLQSNIIREMV